MLLRLGGNEVGVKLSRNHKQIQGQSSVNTCSWFLLETLRDCRDFQRLPFHRKYPKMRRDSPSIAVMAMGGKTKQIVLLHCTLIGYKEETSKTSGVVERKRYRKYLLLTNYVNEERDPISHIFIAA